MTATAHKLARIIYVLLTPGQEDVDQGQQYFEQRCRERVVRQLSKRARDLGMTLVPVPSAA